MGNLIVSFAITNYATAAVLILAFAYLLFKNHTGSNLRYVRLIAWFSICSSVGVIIMAYIVSHAYDERDATFWERFFDGLSATLNYLGFNMAHWIFCFMYFKIQSNMWFLTNNQTVPLEVQLRDQQIDFFFKAVNTLVPILAGCAWFLTVCFSSSSATKDGLLQIYAVLKFTVGVLNMISAGFLCYGVLRIRYISKKRRGDDRLKINQMLLHLGAFVLLLISLFVSNYFYAYYVWGNDGSGKYVDQYLKSRIWSAWISMFSCLLMIKVLLPITEKEDVTADYQATINETDVNVAESGLYATVKVLLVEDDDELIMLNQRIWLQLVDEKPEDRAELLEFSRRTRDRPHRQSLGGSTTMSS